MGDVAGGQLMRIPWRRRRSSLRLGDREEKIQSNGTERPMDRRRQREPWREEGGEGGFVAEGVGSAHSGGEERERESQNKSV